MKIFVIFIALLIGTLVWFKDWATSGRMDAYISQHEDPVITPKVLYALGEFYFVCQEHKTASHYYRWFLDTYPRDPSIARIRWQLGRSYEETGRRGEALEQYTILKDSYSLTEYGQLGHSRYGQLKY